MMPEAVKYKVFILKKLGMTRTEVINRLQQYRDQQRPDQ